MRNILIFFLSLWCCTALAQSESHNMITYDSTYVYQADPYHSFQILMRITRPANLFTTGSSDTASRPVIIMEDGVGEEGSDTTKLYAYGPHYWLKNGWDGSVQLGNGTHYPILITLQWNISSGAGQTPLLLGQIEIVNYIIQHYHVKPTSVHVTGLSEGAFTWSGMVSYEDTVGNEKGMKPITSMALLSGAATSTGTYAIFGHWAKKYHGKAFLTVGYGDAQAPYPPLLEQGMNDSVNGSAYFSYNTIGSGSHCCWNTAYDPNLTSWQSFAPMGTYVTTNTDSNSRGTYKAPSSIFQWMLRQGDTTLVGQGGAHTLTAKEVWPAEYWLAIHANNDTAYAIQAGGNTMTAIPLPGGRLVATGWGGFNNMKCTAQDSTYWISSTYNVSPVTWTQVTTDTLGNPLTNVMRNWSWADGGVLLRGDSTLWLTENDTMGIIHSLGTRYIIGKPIKISPVGVHFKSAVPCGNGLYGLTGDGNVYFWARNQNSITPSHIFTPAANHPMIQITSGTFDAVMGIVAACPTCNYGDVYVKGNSWGDWGGNGTTYSSFTDINSYLNYGGVAKFILDNTNSFHVVDTFGNVWGVAKCNSQGEVGNGLEYVNRYTYSTFPGYGWTFNNTENPVAAPMQLIIAGGIIDTLYSNGFFTFYKIARDKNKNLFFWGRNKTLGMNGRLLYDSSNAANPNALDVTAPKLITPLSTVDTVLRFAYPVAYAGGTQTIGTSSMTLSAGGHAAALVVESAPTDTVDYKWTAWAWGQRSGPNTAIIGNTLAQTTGVSGLINGTYVFTLTETDNNGGTDTTSTTVTVSFTGPTVSAGSNQVIGTTSTNLTGTATGNGGATISSYLWTQVSGPTTASFATPTAAATTASNLAAGVYVFNLKATDSNGNPGNAQVTVQVNIGFNRLSTHWNVRVHQ